MPSDTAGRNDVFDDSVRRRFYAMTEEKGDCLEWTGWRNSQGYGKFGITSLKSYRAHRFAYMLEIGPIPNGALVCHTCDNPACVRASHLFLGTQLDNMRDMVRKGRHNCGRGEAHGMASISDADVTRIRSDTRTQRAIAAAYGISQAQVSRIKSGNSRAQ